MSDPAPTVQKPKRPRSRGWRIFFTIFKWTRVAILLALLSFVIFGIYVNRVGLPAWIQRRIVAQMKTQGWDMDFSWLRLHWYRGVVAHHLQLSRTNSMNGPNLFVETAEFRLNGQALRSFDLQADSVTLSGARLLWPLPGTNTPRQTFVLNKIQGELFFNPGDRWDLRSLQAQWLGAQVRIRGDITNASLIRDWKLSPRPARPPLEHEQNFWSKFLTQAEKVRPLAPPSMTVIFGIDAADPRTLDATARITLTAADSPWGAATNIALTARVRPPPRTHDPLQAEIKLAADQPRTPWGAATNVLIDLQFEPSFTEFFPTNGTLKLELLQPRTPWGDAARFNLDAHTSPLPTNPAARLTLLTIEALLPRTEPGLAHAAQLTARVTHAATNLLPATVESDTLLDRAQTQWATSAWSRVQASFHLPRREELAFSQTNRDWPERLKNVPLDLTAVFSNALGARLDWTQLTLSNRWRPPELRLAAHSQSSAGSVTFESTLDTDSRDAVFQLVARGDPHRLAPWLPTNAQPWLAEFQSTAPVETRLTGRATLPAWTNRNADWLAAVRPTLSLAGRVETGPAALHDIPFTAVRLEGQYTNALWTLPALRFTRPEGGLEADGSVDERTGAFRLNLRSTIDPQALRPAFSRSDQREVFEPFSFTVLPVLAGEVHGNFHDPSTLSVTAAAAVTNVTFRNQFIRYATATGRYTNGFLSLSHILLLRDREQASADGIGIDIRKPRLYLTNAHGNVAPMAVAHAIGPHIVHAIAPYVFDAPPSARVNGSIPIGHSDGTEDLRFEIEGGAFHWWRIHPDQIRGSIHWKGQDLTLTNVQARWRGANAGCWAQFDFRQPRDGGVAFHVVANGGDLGQIVQDLQNGATNHLEGDFDLDLTISHAFVNDIKSWNGYGQARLTNGLLWDIPLFGVASTILNGIIPGLGHSRAKSATATYTITNSVVHTRDLMIEASGMHLKYRGTVDFDGNVDARMDAQLLKGIPGIGPLITVVFWPVTKLFEYRVTRTLGNPKLDEVYFVPKLLLFPLQPLKTMKNIFGGDASKPIENPADRKPRTSPKAAP